jgi:hypothetical protein
MKHLVFFLYLLSYTSGIGTIALSFNYLKSKPRNFKYLIFFDLYFTLELIFDTLGLYFRQIVNYYPVGIIIFILAGSFGSTIGMAYFFGKYVCHSLNRESDNTVTLVLRSGVILTGSALTLLIILTRHRLFPAAIAGHTLFTIISVFINGMMGYYLGLLFLNRNKNEQENGHLPVFALITLLILLPAPILTNLLAYRVNLKFSSWSPISYFIFNLWLIYYNRSLLYGLPAEFTGSGGGNAKKLLLPSLELIKEYHITERELEVSKK